MHPILGDRVRLGMYLLVWVPVGGVMAALLVMSGLPWDEAVAVALPLALVHAFVCLSAWYLCRAVPLRGSSLLRIVGTHTGGALVASALWLMLGRGWASFLDQSLVFPGCAERFARTVPQLSAVGALLFLLAVAVHYVMIAFEVSRLAETRALELKLHSQEAELKALQAQLQPHFLFNSLNSISALTTSDPAGARHMCLLLADFLRKSLSLGAKQDILLSEELSMVEAFLAVEKVRFGTRLRVEYRVDALARECLVPPLLLQPLAENAVTHGLAHLLEGGCLVFEARRNGERLEMAIENPCDPERPRRTGTGVGIANVRRRLLARYGREARIGVVESAGRFRVEIALPAGSQAASPSIRVGPDAA